MNWKSIFFKKALVVDYKDHPKIDKELLQEVLEEREKETPKIKEYIIKHEE